MPSPEEIGRQLAARAITYVSQWASAYTQGVVSAAGELWGGTPLCREDDRLIGRCELLADHDGRHKRGVYEWWTKP